MSRYAPKYQQWQDNYGRQRKALAPISKPNMSVHA
jgi:hypothetical protein